MSSRRTYLERCSYNYNASRDQVTGKAKLIKSGEDRVMLLRTNEL